MADTRHLNSHSGVNTHPDESILLAYLRGQKFEALSNVMQHIENENCPVCNQKLQELEQVINVLDVLGTMRSHQYYPELTAAATYARIESTAYQGISAKTANRHGKNLPRPRKSAIRLISVPFGVGLAILFTAMLVFAGFFGRTPNLISSHGHIRPVPNALTVVVNSHSAATQHPNGTATSIVSSGATPEAKVPHIKVCSTKADIAQLQLVICGFGFNSTHKATLSIFVPGKVPFLLRDIPVDKYGEFHVEWYITDCGNMPTFIYGFEATGSKLIKVRLHIVSFGACVAPPTPVANPSRLSPKFGI